MARGVSQVAVFCPAKVNLCLAITGRRSDGYHNLVSVVAPLRFGDDLSASPEEQGNADSLEANVPDLPVDRRNLVLRAAELFRARVEIPFPVRFALEKRIPVGAGLGGGSSDGAGALKALNVLMGNPLKNGELRELAVDLGSDCPLFLSNGPVIVRGRGERLEPVPQKRHPVFDTPRVLLFMPEFAIETVWAYTAFGKRDPAPFVPESDAEAFVSDWVKSDDRLEKLLFNSFEAVVFEKFLGLPVLLEQLRSKPGIPCLLSGCGSSCFALARDRKQSQYVREAIAEAWGDDAFIVETTFAF